MNELTQHIPAPWGMNVIKIKGKPVCWGINGVSKSGDTYESVRIADVPFSVPNHDRSTQEANARLMTASPDLLEALKLAAEELDIAANYLCDLNVQAAENCKQRAIEARTAIAKASS